MADSNFRGPVNSMGALEFNAATASVEPLDGPGAFYQGVGFPDIRGGAFAKDGFRPGQQPMWLTGNVVLIDQIPQRRTSSQIATAQVMTAATVMTLVTAQIAGLASSAGIAVGVPIVPLGTTVATFAALALDFGFATGTTVTNSSTVIVTDSSVFRQGQWIVVAGAANSSASRSLIAQVQSSPTTTTIQIAPVAATGLGAVPIGQANLWGSALLPPASQFGPSAPVATGHAFGGAIEGGLGRIYNPRELISRNLTFFGGDQLSGYSAIISGWDVYGAPMTELVSSSATTTQGKKAFKYISSITSGTSQAAGTTVAVGLGDVIGLPIRADSWEEIEATWNGVTMTNFSGFVAGVFAAATSSTGDVRGTLQLSTAVITGAAATAMSVIASNGTGRLWVSMNLTPSKNILATPINPAPMFGVAQSTAVT